MRTRQERILMASCDFLNAIPLWGLLFCGWVWFWQREESRPVVRAAQEAMMFHTLLMGGLLIYLLLGWVARLSAVLSPTLGFILDQLNLLIVTVLLIAYAAVCLYGGAHRLSGQSFHYPLVSRRK